MLLNALGEAPTIRAAGLRDRVSPAPFVTLHALVCAAVSLRCPASQELVIRGDLRRFLELSAQEVIALSKATWQLKVHFYKVT